ncbi:MAG: cytochrome hydroxylase [Labilithrix sp.]|nr:cytochrome hydroxylase [Labilithrix sp.]
MVAELSRERSERIEPTPRPARLPTAPGPDPVPLLGAIPHLLRFGRDSIGTAGRLFERYGPLASIVRAPARIMSPRGISCVVANGPALNREVLTQHERYRMYALPGTYFPEASDLARARTRGGTRGRPSEDRLRPIQRTLTGLFHVNGDEHRRHRRLLQPAFNKTRIDAYRDDMVALTQRMLDEWREGEERDVHADMTELTLRIATKTLFGEDAGERGVALARMMQHWLITMFSPGMLLRLDLKGLPYSRWLDLTRSIDDETAALLRDKREAVARRASSDPHGPIAADMLSMLVAARDEDGSALDEDELVGHVGVIFGAGHETSTNALAWTLFLLAEHPEAANELDAELAGVLHGDPPTVEQLAKLPFLDAVVKESMRVLPPVPLHPRVVAEDTELGGHFLPANTELFLSIFHMHHDPALFTNPDRFDPMRWSKIKPSVYEYNPFSAGPRMCIGAAFATMEIKIALAMLLQRFRVERTRATRVDRRVAITLAPKHGLTMRIRRADGAWVSARRSLPDVRGNIREIVELP